MVPLGKFKKTSFCEEIQEQTEKDADPEGQVASHTSSGDDKTNRAEEHESDDDDERRQAHKFKGPESELASLPSNTVVPLIIFPVWDEITVWSQIRLLGPGSLRGLCDEAQFVRKHLPATTARLRQPTCHEFAARLLLLSMIDDTLPIPILEAIAKLLPRSLKIAEPTSGLYEDFVKTLSQPKIWHEKIPLQAALSLYPLFSDLHKKIFARAESEGKREFMESRVKHIFRSAISKNR